MRNFRNTKSVKIILDAFGESNNALSVVALVERFQNDMNKTTVYRILERLEQRGILHSFSSVDGLKWYAKSKQTTQPKHTSDHPHFQCRECGKSECLTVNITIPNIPNHRIDSVNLILTGQCADCLSQ